MPTDSNREIEVVRLGHDEEPPADAQWILVISSPQHAYGETLVHAQGQTYMAPPDDMVMSIYNAQASARELGMTRVYVKDSGGA